MISTQKLLNCLNEIKEITKLDLALFHDSGKLAVATMPVDARLESIVSEFSASEAEQQTYMDYLFYRIGRRWIILRFLLRMICLDMSS